MSGRRGPAPDPWFVSVAVFGAAAASGLVAILLGWRGVAARVDVAEQLPYVMSGVVVGLAVLGFALGVVVIQARRRAEAYRRAEIEDVIGAIERLASVVRAGSRD